jgi:beta-glucosidase
MKNYKSVDKLGVLILIFFANHSLLKADPSLPKITPTKDQQTVIFSNNAVPCDQASIKLDLYIQNGDGTPNPNFGKPQARFLQKHQEFLERDKLGPIGVLFLGDSITEGWCKWGNKYWGEYLQKYNAADFGIGGDNTQNLLWRIENGELDHISPKLVILMIGTNDLGHPADQVLKGDLKVIEMIRKKLPNAKLLLLGILPNGNNPAAPRTITNRERIKVVNQALASLDDGDKIRYLDIGNRFLQPDGSIPTDLMPDGLHPNEKGYQIWAEAMQPLLNEMLH